MNGQIQVAKDEMYNINCYVYVTKNSIQKGAQNFKKKRKKLQQWRIMPRTPFNGGKKFIKRQTDNE